MAALTAKLFSTLILANFAAGQQSCPSSPNAIDTNQFSGGSVLRYSSSLQIFADMTFPCSGTLTSWDYVSFGSTGKFYLGAWRQMPSPMSDSVMLVGRTAIKPAKSSMTVQTYTLKVSEQFAVETGDMVGLFFETRDQVLDQLSVPYIDTFTGAASPSKTFIWTIGNVDLDSQDDIVNISQASDMKIRLPAVRGYVTPTTTPSLLATLLQSSTAAPTVGRQVRQAPSGVLVTVPLSQQSLVVSLSTIGAATTQLPTQPVTVPLSNTNPTSVVPKIAATTLTPSQPVTVPLSNGSPSTVGQKVVTAAITTTPDPLALQGSGDDDTTTVTTTVGMPTTAAMSTTTTTMITPAVGMPTTTTAPAVATTQSVAATMAPTTATTTAMSVAAFADMTINGIQVWVIFAIVGAIAGVIILILLILLCWACSRPHAAPAKRLATGASKTIEVQTDYDPAFTRPPTCDKSTNTRRQMVGHSEPEQPTRHHRPPSVAPVAPQPRQNPSVIEMHFNNAMDDPKMYPGSTIPSSDFAHHI